MFCPGGGEGWHSGSGEMGGKEVGRRIWYKKCIHMYVNAKMIPVQTIPGIKGGSMKESCGGGELKYDISDIL
jgi:hypothetical protein